ncbi:MAG: hypothetical protein AAGA54_25370 [Myxococcota bacterium]
MLEALLVVVCIIALLAVVALEPITGIRLGLVVSIGGVLLGSVAGGLYHWRLRSALLARDALPKRWWVNPVALHASLTDDERRRTLPSFYVGAAFFAVCVLGCAAMVSGLARLLM